MSSLKLWFSVDWHELAYNILIEYSNKVGIEPPRLIFGFEAIGKPRSKHLGYASRLGEIFITNRFDEMFKIDPKHAEIVLRQVIAHEIGHILLFKQGKTRHGEKKVNKMAEKICGINYYDMGYSYRVMYPYKDPKMQEQSLNFYRRMAEQTRL